MNWPAPILNRDVTPHDRYVKRLEDTVRQLRKAQFATEFARFLASFGDEQPQNIAPLLASFTARYQDTTEEILTE